MGNAAKLIWNNSQMAVNVLSWWGETDTYWVGYSVEYRNKWPSLVAQLVRNPPAM